MEGNKMLNFLYKVPLITRVKQPTAKLVANTREMSDVRNRLLLNTLRINPLFLCLNFPFLGG